MNPAISYSSCSRHARVQLLALGFLVGATFAPNLNTFTGTCSLRDIWSEFYSLCRCSNAMHHRVLRVSHAYSFPFASVLTSGCRKALRLKSRYVLGLAWLLIDKVPTTSMFYLGIVRGHRYVPVPPSGAKGTVLCAMSQVDH